MMKLIKYYLSFCLVISCHDSGAQIFQRVFYNTGGDDYGGKCVKKSATEYFINGSVSSDAAIIKLNGNGDTIWTKVFGGVSDDGGVVYINNNQPYIIGATGNPSFGEYDVTFTKINNTNGDTLFTKRYGTPWAELCLGACPTADTGFLVYGVRNNLPNPPYDWFLIKTNAAGDTLWTKTLIGASDEESCGALQMPNGGYIFAGSTNSFGAGDYDIVVFKLDANGNPVTCKTFGGSSLEAFSSIKSCNGGYVIAGTTTSYGAGNSDAFLMKIDTNLNIIWANAYGTGTDDQGYSLEVTSNGGFVIAGRIGLTTSSVWDAYLIKTDSAGTLLWSKKYSPSIDTDWANYVIETTDMGYLITGSSYNSSTGYDVYLIKTDSSGNSGCNQTNESTTTTNITSLLITGTGTFTVGNPGLILGYYPVNVWSGLQMNTYCYTGIDNVDPGIASFSSFPNPTSSNLNLEYSIPLAAKSAYIEIYDVIGQKIARHLLSPQSSKTQISIENLQNGSYFCILFCDNNVLGVTQFVVSK